MTFCKLTISALLVSSSFLEAQKLAPRNEISGIDAQLASIQQQTRSVETQRLSVAKQEVSTHRMSKQTAFLEPLRNEVQYLDCDRLAPRETERLIATAARRQSVSAELLRAVIRQESAFRPCAVSEKGAQGLMQLMPATAAAFNVSDPFDPQQNILGGAAYLRQLMQRYAGDASLALSAYNAGPQIVDRIEGIPDIPETQNYVTSIFRDLGWTLPTKPALLPETGWDQAEPEADVKLDETEAVAPPAEIGTEQQRSNPIKEKPPEPPSSLP